MLYYIYILYYTVYCILYIYCILQYTIYYILYTVLLARAQHGMLPTHHLPNLLNPLPPQMKAELKSNNPKKKWYRKLVSSSESTQQMLARVHPNLSFYANIDSLAIYQPNAMSHSQGMSQT